MRTLATALAVLVLAVGCVTVSTPSEAPSLAPSLPGVTTPRPPQSPSPTAPGLVTSPPTQSAVPIPTAIPATPTAGATATAGATPGTGPTGAPSATPGADAGDLLFLDEMDDPSSGWAVGEFGESAAAYVDGTLRLSISEAGQALWSARRLEDEYGVILVAGAFAISGGAGTGAACLTPDNEIYGAEITTNQSLIFFSIINGTTQALETRQDLDIDVPQGATYGFGVECTGTSTGALRLVAVMQNEGTLGVYQSDEGPETFNGVTMYGEAVGDAATVDVDEAAAWGITGSAEGEQTLEGEELLTHVPDDWQQTCIELPSTSEATAVISCILQSEGVGVELAVYEQFETQEDLDAAYEQTLDTFGGADGEDCASGPGETTWNRGDATRGMLLCAPQGVGIRFDWTDNELLILSTLFDLDGDYENTYNLWADAGPF